MSAISRYSCSWVKQELQGKLYRTYMLKDKKHWALPSTLNTGNPQVQALLCDTRKIIGVNMDILCRMSRHRKKENVINSLVKSAEEFFHWCSKEQPVQKNHSINRKKRNNYLPANKYEAKQSKITAGLHPIITQYVNTFSIHNMLIYKKIVYSVYTTVHPSRFSCFIILTRYGTNMKSLIFLSQRQFNEGFKWNHITIQQSKLIT